jgi:hypothetical protein
LLETPQRRNRVRPATKEILRQWVGGAGCRRIAARVGLDVKTLRRYVHAAQAASTSQIPVAERE